MVNYMLIRKVALNALLAQKIDEQTANAIADAIKNALVEYEMQTSGKKLH